MKTQSLSVLALASVAAATGFGSSGSFNCPSNTNNECNTQQKPGYSWGDLNTGSFSDYGGMKFSGYSCQNSFGKRDGLTKRTFADSKCIKGKATTDKASSPKIDCGSSTSVPNKQFSVTEMHVSVEFDCDLEFHYEMPDKSTCKHTAGCSSAGSIVKNTQCGGATGVTVVYPSQKPGKNTGKTGCDVGIHSIGFDCGPASSSTIRASSSTVKPSSSASKPTSVATTLSSATKPTTTAASSTKPAESSKVIESTSKASESSKSVATTPASSKPVESTKVVESSTKPVESSKSTSENSGVTSSVKQPITNSTTPVVSIPTTTAPVQLTTSTVYATSVSTIISCAADVKNCPANSQTTALVTVTIPISTTICPVSEASTTPGSKPSSSLVVPSASSFVTSAKPTSVGENSGASSSAVKPSGSTSVFVPAPSDIITTVIVSQQTTVCPFTSTHVTAGTTSIQTGITTSTIATTITSTVCSKCEAAKTSTAPAGPVTTAPGVPDVLPKCMNTWNFIVGCIDNTDASCYCPDNDFVNNVFGCLTAYGADASIVSAAASYFQGICAPYIPQNPAIITACPSSSAPSVPSVVASSNSGAITTAPAVLPSVPVTTINVYQTVTVPCVQSTGVSSGLIIPSSSTQTVISTALTVPQVVFSTPAAVSGNSGATGSPAAPVLVIGTPAAVVATTTPSKAAPAASTVPTSYAGSNGTAKASPVPTSPLTTNGGASMTVAFSSIFGAALIAVFAL